MEHVFRWLISREAVDWSVSTLEQAAPADAEDPRGNREKAAALRQMLQDLHANSSPENATEALVLAKGVLSSVLSAAYNEIAVDRQSLALATRRWAWDLIGKALAKTE